MFSRFDIKTSNGVRCQIERNVFTRASNMLIKSNNEKSIERRDGIEKDVRCGEQFADDAAKWSVLTIKVIFKNSSEVSPSLIANKRKRERKTKGVKSGAKREGGENTRGERERMSELVGELLPEV